MEFSLLFVMPLLLTTKSLSKQLEKAIMQRPLASMNSL